MGSLCTKDKEEECLKNRTNHNDSYCNTSWDGYLCWEPTETGTTALQSCPPNQHLKINGTVSRMCMNDRKWNKTDFAACLPKEGYDLLKNLGPNPQRKFEVAETVRLLEYFGLGISLFFLIISLYIFTHYRSLKNTRTRIHKNLFTAMTIQVIARLIMYIDNGSCIPYLCLVMVTFLEYARTSMFMWMFVEGLYLHSMITLGFLHETVYYRIFKFIGWGLPVALTSAWLTVMILFRHDVHCWAHYSLTGYFWILEGPRMGAIVINFLFLLNIVRVLVIKLRERHTSEIEQVRKAVRAAVFLVPLMGITNLLQIWDFYSSAPLWEFAFWMFIIYFLVSFQGFFISLLYCLLNGEVRSAIRNSINSRITYNSVRSQNYYRGRNSTNDSILETHP